MRIAETKLFSSQFISAQAKSDKLMIVLHGRGDSIKPFAKFDEELQIPEMNYLLLNAPRKFLDVLAGTVNRLTRGMVWYVSVRSSSSF